MLRLDARSLPEWLLLAPLLGLMATVFVTIGEVRYRVPFDIFFIVIACAFAAGDFAAAADPVTLRELTEARA